jgi:3-methyladenine DNA glycosylase AlkC
MLRKIGRLDEDAKKEINQLLESIFKLIEDDKKELAETKLFKLAQTPNYFIREYVGSQLAEYHDQRRIHPFIKQMIEHELYGIRATALFYYSAKYSNEPDKLLNILEQYFESVPWEAESIINELWKKRPELMKKSMKQWILSEKEAQRALAFHGMENIAYSDPDYIMDFVSLAIDDDSMEVQKKITHVLSQVARAKPIIVYPYIREWLSGSNDKRKKTIWVSMKKLANLVGQNGKRDKSYEFILLTEQTIKDWALDDNDHVSNMGKKLLSIISKK